MVVKVPMITQMVNNVARTQSHTLLGQPHVAINTLLCSSLYRRYPVVPQVSGVHTECLSSLGVSNGGWLKAPSGFLEHNIAAHVCQKFLSHLRELCIVYPALGACKNLQSHFTGLKFNMELKKNQDLFLNKFHGSCV